MNNEKPSSKLFIIILLAIALVGIPLTLYAIQQRQVLNQFAFSTQQSATAECSAVDGSAVIKVTFANTESSTPLTVTANDLQTGTFVSLGTIQPQGVNSVDIVTLHSSLSNGTVVFKLTAPDGSTSQVSATYNAINNCPAATMNYCPVSGQNNQGLCEWTPVSNATGYNVVVKELDTGTTGTVVLSTTVSQNASQIAFPMSPGTPYTCTVTPTNTCGAGSPTTSTAKVCPLSPVPSQAISPTPTLSPSPIPSLSPTPILSISPTPAPTATPAPTSTPAPTATPLPTSTPLPTPTPIVIVRTITQPPQITIQPTPTPKPYSPVTPVPTVMATGDTTPTFILAGASTVLLLAGGLIFFIL